MHDPSPADQELVDENALLKQRIKQLEDSEAGHTADEEALRESEAALRRAQEITHIGHFKFNPATGVVEGADELFRLFGLTRDDFQFSDFVASVRPDQRDFVVSAIQGALARGTGYNIEHDLQLRDGTLRFVNAIGEVATMPPAGQPVLGVRCRTSPSASGPRRRSSYSKPSSSRRRRWNQSAGWRAAWRTTSTLCVNARDAISGVGNLLTWCRSSVRTPTLTVEGLNETATRSIATVTMVQEGSEWKVGKES